MHDIKTIEIPERYTYISSFLTFRCNLSCSYCINNMEKENRNRNETDGQLLIEGLNRIKTRPNLPITFSGGEPSQHPDFVKIIKGIKKETPIDILTNLIWSTKTMNEFIDNIDPNRLNRDAKYPNIRVSYHPGQQNIIKLTKTARMLKDKGYSIGIYSVMYPSQEQIAAIYQAQFACIDAGVEFRLKEFVGEFKGEVYGTFAYPDVLNQYYSDPENNSNKMILSAMCRTSELLISPSGHVHRCHSDLYNGINPIGHINDNNFQIKDIFRYCNDVKCNLCDIKQKTNYKQELGNCAVEIKDIEKREQL